MMHGPINIRLDIFALWVTEMFSETSVALHRATQLSKSTSAYRNCIGLIF